MEMCSNTELLRLIFIHVVGESFNGQKKYQFLFSKLNSVSYPNWERTPALSNVTIPEKETTEIIEVELKQDFWFLKDSHDFSYIDSQTINIPIAVEVKNKQQSGIKKVAFFYGESYTDVKTKLLHNYKIILD